MGKSQFDRLDTFWKSTFLGTLEAEFENTPIGRFVVLFVIYNFVKTLDTMFCVKIWFKFEFKLLTTV